MVSTKVKKNIVKNCNKTCCLCQCARNVLKGNVPFSNPQKNKLHRFRQKLRDLASKKTRVTIKKKLLQSGGFLSALLTPEVSFLGAILNPTR